MADEKKIVVALAGNPNCGKTTLFNSLTGSTAYVGNWPGVTVEKREGTYKSKKGDTIVDVVDLPGIYSLSPYTPEEVVARNFILEGHPDCVINVLDATNLERNLYMTTQILEMDVPVVVALNMMDAVKDNGMTIDCEAISKKLGVPVVPVSALRETGLDDLMKAAAEACKTPRQGKSFWNYGDYASKVDEALAVYKDAGVEDPLFHAIKALEGDEIEAEKEPESYNKVKEFGISSDEFEAGSADNRYKFITSELACYRTGAPVQESKKLSKSDKIDKVLTNKWAAIPLFVIIFFIIFHVTFAGDLFYLNSMGVDFGEGYQGLIHFAVDGEEVYPFAGLFFDDAGFCSIGEFLHRLAGDNETGIMGLICLGIKNLLTMWNSPDWLIGLVYDGVLNGVCAVLGFLPQILLLFFFFAILEDSGYMARVAFVLDRIFRRFGVSGRAFLPMIMGFGCGVPAMINTRTLSTDKERTKTIRVIPYFTCGAKAEILTAVAAGIAEAFAIDTGLFTFGMYLLGVVLAIVFVIAMNKTSQREAVPPFIMELPSYHMPQPKALGIHVWDKAKHFIKKAFTIIFVSTIVIWFLNSFTWDWKLIADCEETFAEYGYASFEAMEASSILASLGKLIQPLFTPMGFGVQTGEAGWVYGVATIQGVVAKEAVTGTLEELAAIVGGTGEVGDMFTQTGLTLGGVFGFTVFNLFTIPCFASVATAKGELATKKDYLGTIAFWLGGAYALGVIFYLLVDSFTNTNWSTAARVITPIVVVAVIALAVVGVVMYDKKMAAKEKALAEQAA